MKKTVLRSILGVMLLICIFAGILTVNEVYAYTQGWDGMGPVVITGGQRDFSWPVPGNYNLQSCFYDHRNHCAIDISAAKGTSVVASYPGTVVAVFSNCTHNSKKDYTCCNDGFGNYVVLKHNYVRQDGTSVELFSRYSHLTQPSVSVGDSVSKGTKIGTIGSTGYSQGFHLDFQILYGAWRPYQTYSIDPYANQLLELPSNLAIYDGWECGTSYYNLTKELYSRPGKPVLQCDLSNSSIVFYWNPTENTTHYNLWLDEKDSAGNWQSVEQIFYAENGLSRTLEPGNYRAQLLSYNSNAWESDGSDWLHTWADDVFFEIQQPAKVTYHTGDGDVWATQSAYAATSVVLRGDYPRVAEKYFCGWSYTKDSDDFDVRPGEIAKITGDTDLYPVYVSHEYVINGGEVYIYNIEDFTATGYQIETLEKNKEKIVNNSYWTQWSDYRTTPVSSSATVEVKTAPMYRYYYFLCPSCGAHEPFSGKSDCGANIPTTAGKIGWFTTPFSQSNYGTFSYTTAKYYTTSLGDGQMWIFSSGNLYDTQIGTLDASGSDTVITTGYSFRKYVEDYTVKTTTIYAYKITPISVASGTCGDNLTWTLTYDGVLSISGTGYMTNYYNAWDAPWCDFQEQITSVQVHSGVQTIGSHAFDPLYNVTEISLPDTLRQIGYRAFAGATVKCITIPAGVWYISYGAFGNHDAVYVDPQNPYYCTDSYGVLYDSSMMELLWAPKTLNGIYKPAKDVQTIGDMAFANCTQITGLTLPEGLLKIRDLAIYNCYRLQQISLPNSLKHVDVDAFTNCSALKSVCYEGTPEEFNSIEIGVYNDELLNAAIYYGHNYTVYTRAATCTEEGLVWKHCGVCSKEVEEVVPMIGHMETTVPAIQPTCISNGRTQGSYCSVCGQTLVAWETIAPTGHGYTAVITQPTCLEGGFTAHMCDSCGDCYYDTYTGALGHSERVIPGYEATCEEPGMTDGVYCTRCQTYLVVPEMIWKDHNIVTIPGIPATCTQSGISDGEYCADCNELITQQRVIPPAHQYKKGECAICGRKENAIAAIWCKGSEVEDYTDFTILLKDYDPADQYILLMADTTVNVYLTTDIYLDFNGQDLSGTIITNGYQIYGMDSTTDGYTCANVGTFDCVDENGKPIIPVRQFKSDITGSTKRYMAIEGENGYTFHRVYLGITKVSLRTGNTGFGYKAVFYGDEMVLANIDSFGFKLNLAGNDTVITKSLDGTNLEMGREYSLSLKNFDIEKYGEVNVNAEVFLNLKDGDTVTSSSVSYSMKTMLQKVCQILTQLTDGQIQALKAMCQPFKAVLTNWGIDALLNDE